jgi:lysophospholipase L1-like esterase
VVIINLGTNDAAAFQQPSQYVDEATGELFDQKINEDGTFDALCVKRLQDAMVAFLGKVRYYNPTAHILWGYGMMDTSLNDCIIQAVEQYIKATGDADVSTLELPIVSADTIGSREHPGVKCHRLFAEKLAPEIAKFLKNK